MKGCKIDAVRVTHLLLNENQTYISDHPVLSEFRDVFHEEIQRLYPLNEKYIFPLSLYLGLHQYLNTISNDHS